MSECARLKQLLIEEELGDHHPTQLLHRMRQLLGEQTENAHVPLLHELFLQRLRQLIRMVLAAAGEIPLDRLATLADRVTECTGSTIASVSCQPQDSAMTRLGPRIEELTTFVAVICPTSPRRSRPCSVRHGSPHLSRRSSPARSFSSDSTICWYRRSFQDRAVKCTHACSWTGNQPTEVGYH